MGLWIEVRDARDEGERLDGLESKTIRVYRPFEEYAADGRLGDPTLARADAGAELFARHVDAPGPHGQRSRSPSTRNRPTASEYRFATET